MDFRRFFKFLLEKISWNCVEFMPKTNKMWMILIILSLFGMKKHKFSINSSWFSRAKRLKHLAQRSSDELRRTQTNLSNFIDIIFFQWQFNDIKLFLER